jgi:uncharacterized protein YndB with AHSA1/START domain
MESVKPVGAALAICQLSLATFLPLSLPPLQRKIKFPMSAPNSTPEITVTATIHAPKHIVWECYTEPEHIIHWNFAGDDWCCPRATYTAIHPGQSFTYQFGDRFATATLQDVAGTNPSQTRLTITFDAETINPIELQQQGWQAILDRFKGYVEGR